MGGRLMRRPRFWLRTLMIVFRYRALRLAVIAHRVRQVQRHREEEARVLNEFRRLQERRSALQQEAQQAITKAQEGLKYDREPTPEAKDYHIIPLELRREPG